MTRALVTQLSDALDKCTAWPGAHDECSAAITAARAYLATEPTPTLTEALAQQGIKLRTEFEPKQRDHIEDSLGMVGERAELIAKLRTGWTVMEESEFERLDDLCRKAADVLEADADLRTQLARRTVERDMAISMIGDCIDEQQATPYGWTVSGVPSVMSGSLAQEIQEQEAKRIGGTCKAFPVYTAPQQVKRVPMTEKQIDKIHADTARLAQIRTTFFIAFARAIEAHHGITEPADKPTGWDNGLSQDYCKEFGKWLASRPGARQQIKAMFDEPEEEDLYALALKADNWGQP